MRNLALAAGGLIVCAAAHVSITATGGYLAPSAPLQVAVAVGLIAGAICVGIAWRDRRRALAVGLMLAMAAGEAFAIIMTAERVVAVREAQQAPIRDAEAERISLVTRLEKAEAAKKAADAAAIEKSAEKHCLSNCRQLLQDQIAAAQIERDAARQALTAMKPPASSTPLADRLGIAGWALDLITAALASIAANGLGALLVAFGAHGRREGEKPATAAPEPQTPPLAASPFNHATRFGRAMLRPAPASTSAEDLYTAYLAWCHEERLKPFSPREIGAALNDVFAEVGLRVERIRGEPHVVGAALKPRRRALGHMTPKTV